MLVDINIQTIVLEATLLLSNRLLPHNITIRVGHPAIIDCASSFTSIPVPTFEWKVYQPFTRDLRASDDMVIGLNGSLYIRNPTLHHIWLGLECTINNEPMGMTGYIQLLVDYKA